MSNVCMYIAHAPQTRTQFPPEARGLCNRSRCSRCRGGGPGPDRWPSPGDAFAQALLEYKFSAGDGHNQALLQNWRKDDSRTYNDNSSTKKERLPFSLSLSASPEVSSSSVGRGDVLTSTGITHCSHTTFSSFKNSPNDFFTCRYLVIGR